MPIGVGTAILGSAAIAGAVGIGGAALSAGATKKAGKTASNAEIAMAKENNKLATQFRAENTKNFQPWMQSGTRANSLVDSFLYGAPAAPRLGGAAPGLAPAPGGAQGTQQYGSAIPYGSVPDGTAGVRRPFAKFSNEDGFGISPSGKYTITRSPGPGSQGRGQGGAGAPVNAMSGYDAFVNSPYYQNPLQEGYRGLNHGYAANGMIESGAAMKGITKFGQDYAAGRQDEFIGMAERQSDRGIQGASAIAGVGQNALASMSANNNAIGNSQANRAIAGGVANANMWSGIGSAVGGALGGLGRSSYGQSSYGGGSSLASFAPPGMGWMYGG